MNERILEEYRRVLEFCQRHQDRLPPYLLEQSVKFEKGRWRDYLSLLRAIPIPLAGLTVVDFGCKYGHLLPLLICLGAEMAMGIDAEEEYTEAGRFVFETLYPSVRILKSEAGYIPLQPDSVDVVILNEVVSHINPGFLDTVWLEVSRILRVDGILLISDGNNIAHPYARQTLPDLYEKWEKGPEGARTDRDQVIRPFVTRRAEIIRQRHPELTDDQVNDLARNTSGLFGDFLDRTIDHYALTGELIRRPYRRGICPTNPSSSGAVMERGLHPAYLEMALAEYGLEARQILTESSGKGAGPIARMKDVYRWARRHLRNLTRPGWQRTSAPGFHILAIKRW
ncbi:MAG: class I SAM-dependent methyltransferase [candidate division NC10 bacterium]|nr:class I SAM-dependent methyltransferase [candidate division NC10 bacterium]